MCRLGGAAALLIQSHGGTLLLLLLPHPSLALTAAKHQSGQMFAAVWRGWAQSLREALVFQKELE